MRDRFAHWHLSSHVRDNNFVHHNFFQNCDDYTIEVDGNNAVVSDNSISGCDYCIDIVKCEKHDATCNLTRLLSEGDNAVVSDNSISACYSCIYTRKCEKYDATGRLTRLFTEGDNPTVTGNTLAACYYDCIEVDCLGGCTAGRVADNFVDGSTDDDDVRSGIVCNRGNWND